MKTTTQITNQKRVQLRSETADQEGDHPDQKTNQNHPSLLPETAQMH